MFRPSPAARQRGLHGVLPLVAGLILLWTGALRAADPTTDEPFTSPDVLKRMTVEELLAQPVLSASRQPEAWSDAASDIFLIRGPTVRATGATTLPEMLRLAPNLFVAQANSWQWAVNARGFVRSDTFSNKLLVIVDGRTVYSPLFSNVFWDSTSVFLPDLDRIEVISGPAGATWGANAVNGVINIETKPAQETLGGLVTTTAGTDVNALGVRYGAKVGETGAIRFFLQGADHGGTFSGTGTDDGLDKWTSRQGGMRADWGTATTGAFTVSGDYYTGRFENPGAPETLSDNGNLLARWSRDLSADSQLWVRAYYDYSKRDDQAVLTEITRTTDLEFQHTLRIDGEQQLLWGADYRFLSDAMQTSGFAIIPPKLDFVLASVFAQHQWTFDHDRFQLTTGLRLEHNHFSGWEYEPSLRFALRLPDNTFWASASRATRIPSRLETGFYEPATPPYLVVGGDGVVAEVVDATEIGWRSHPLRDFSITTTAFVNDYNHLRSVEPTTPVTFANGVRGHSYGIELFLDWQVTPAWRMRFGGFQENQSTWTIPGFHDLEKARGESSYPDYQAQFRNVFRLTKSVSLWTSLRHVAEVPVEHGGPPVPAYTELDATLNWAVTRQINVSIAGRNLLHRSHVEIGENATQREIPRGGEASLRLRF